MVDKHEHAPEWGKDFRRLKLLGGRLPLNFTNTLHQRLPQPEGDVFDHYGDLLTWSVHAGALSLDEAAHLWHEAQTRPDEARRVFRHAIQLREAIHDIFAAYLYNLEPAAHDLQVLNNEIKRAQAHLEIVPDGDVFVWRWHGDAAALDRMLWPVAREAGALLTSGDVRRVRECGGCGWLFLDVSKNHSRRWCSMEICGNQAKARRHYQRQRSAKMQGE